MSKYRNKRCECDGHKFASQLERDFYLACKAWQRQRKILGFKMQVPFKLHGGIKYMLDFQIYIQTSAVGEVLAFDVHNVEVKGYWTAVARLKKKLFEADYGPLEVHTADKPWTP